MQVVRGKFYLQNLADNDDFVTAIRETRSRLDPVVNAYSNKGNDTAYTTFATGYVHIIWEQYLHTYVPALQMALDVLSISRASTGLLILSWRCCFFFVFRTVYGARCLWNRFLLPLCAATPHQRTTHLTFGRLQRMCPFFPIPPPLLLTLLCRSVPFAFLHVPVRRTCT